MKVLALLSTLALAASVVLAEEEKSPVDTVKQTVTQVLTPLQTLLAPVKGIGASSQYHSQDNLGNYAYGYDEGHATGGTYRRESGSPGVKVGSYGLRDADGRYRTVNYVADALGYRVDIQTNEPGVEPKDPASATINKVHGAAPKMYSQLLPASVAVPASHVVSQMAAAPQIISQGVSGPVESAPKMYSQLLPAPVAMPASQVLSQVVASPQIISQVASGAVESAPKMYSQLLPAPVAVPAPQVLSQVVAAPQLVSKMSSVPVASAPTLYSNLLPAPMVQSPAPLVPQVVSAGQMMHGVPQMMHGVPQMMHGVPQMMYSPLHYSPYLSYGAPINHHRTYVTHYTSAQPQKSEANE